MEVKVNHRYRCKDGSLRWVVWKHPHSKGFQITWDTENDLNEEGWSKHSVRLDKGLAGVIPCKKFESMVVADETPK